MSLHVVAANHPNADGGNRRFEILLCVPGEPVDLLPEPKNPVDRHAMAIFSARGVQIGYLTADRAPWIGGMLRRGRELQAVFQATTHLGAAIRIAFDGEAPILPPERPALPLQRTESDGFWPDYISPDE